MPIPKEGFPQAEQPVLENPTPSIPPQHYDDSNMPPPDPVDDLRGVKIQPTATGATGPVDSEPEPAAAEAVVEEEYEYDDSDEDGEEIEDAAEDKDAKPKKKKKKK